MMYLRRLCIFGTYLVYCAGTLKKAFHLLEFESFYTKCLVDMHIIRLTKCFEMYPTWLLAVIAKGTLNLETTEQSVVAFY